MGNIKDAISMTLNGSALVRLSTLDGGLIWENKGIQYIGYTPAKEYVSSDHDLTLQTIYINPSSGEQKNWYDEYCPVFPSDTGVHKIHKIQDHVYVRRILANVPGIEELDLSHINSDYLTEMHFMGGDYKKFNFSNLNTSKITSMESMFQNVAHPDMLDLTKWDVSNVTNMQYMFSHAQGSSREKPYFLHLSRWDTRKVTNMTSMFKYNDNLSILSVDGWNLQSCPLEKMRDMLLGCTNLFLITATGCDESTVSKLRTACVAAGLSGDIIRTST